MDTNKLKNILATLQNGVPQGAIASMVCNSLREKGELKPIYNAAPAGYQQQIDTLTFIKQETISQQFYEINPAEFVPIKVGEGAWTNESLYYTDFKLIGDFEAGIIGQGTGTRKAKTQVGFDSVRLPNFFWANELDYSLIEVQQASQNLGSAISLIKQKEEAQKMAWDLGIQKTAFLGLENVSDVEGLLTLSNVVPDPTTIANPISGMNPTDINAFVKNIVGKFFLNSNKTAYPDTFVMPTFDYLGLGSFVSELRPDITKYKIVLEAFIFATGNPNFKITSVQYSDKSDNNLGLNRYVLYKNNSRTLEMNIPIDYTSTSFGTANGFDFSSVAYGQFSGVIAKRPLEIMYFDNTVTLG